MAFQQLGWFPASITPTVDNPVHPVAVSGRYLYPGDTLINPETEAVYYILETGIGSLNESVTYYSTEDDKQHTRGKDSLVNLLQNTVSHQRCLAFAVHDPPDMDDLIYLYLSYGETDTGVSGVYHAWWVVASANDVDLSTPTDDERNTLTQQSFLQLRSRLRSRPSWDGVGHLRQLVATHEGLETTINTLLDTAVETMDYRVPTDAPMTTDGRDLSGQIHKPADSIPTIKNSEAITLDQQTTIYTGDRFFLDVPPKGGIRGFPDCATDQACLNSAEHLVVLEVDTSGRSDSATVHYFFHDKEAVLTGVELGTLIATVKRDGGRYFRCLARDGSVQVLGTDAPSVYSMHVYHVLENSTHGLKTYYLLAYDKHQSKGVMLEHPLALETHTFDDQTSLVEALQNPRRFQHESDPQPDVWDPTNQNFVDMCTRVANSTQQIGRSRGILQPQNSKTDATESPVEEADTRSH